MMHKLLYGILLLYLSSSLAVNFNPIPGTRLWDLTKDVGKEVCTTESKVCTVDSKVDTLILCAPIPLDAAGTISSSGVYCLTQNITGNITIDADLVELDLNGKQVNGTISVSNHSKIIIRNGTIINASSNGISLSTVSEINIANLTILVTAAATDSLTGSSVTNFTFTNLKITDGNGNGILLSNSSNGLIEHAQCHNNAQNGISITSSSSEITIKDCVLYGNAGSGLSITSSSQNTAKNCEAQASGFGFIILTGTCNQLIGCSVGGAGGNGFSLSGTDILCKQCTACSCISAGFSVTGGSTTGVLKENIALSCTTGFSDGTTSMKYVANYSSGNTTNYSPGAGAPFDPLAPTSGSARYWRNITD